MIEGEFARVRLFSQHHWDKYKDKTEIVCKGTSVEEEIRIVKEIIRIVDEDGNPAPGDCALNVSDAIEGSRWFPGVSVGDWHRWPGNLFRAAQEGGFNGKE